MRVALVLNGRPVEVEVDLEAGVARLDAHEYPIHVVSGDGDLIELEIAGEKVRVEGWWKGLSDPPKGGVSVNGERVEVSVASRSGGAAAASAAPAPGPVPVLTSAPGPARAPAPSDTGPGVAIVPPMPGKVIEVRVKDGEAVVAGQVVLVLEAMKMRNEVTSPLAGTVADVRVSPGTNVRAKEPMLRILPP